MRLWHKILTVVLLFPFLALNAQDQQNQTAKFGRLLRLVESYYVDSTNLEKLTEEAIIGLLNKLDPHSVYISKEEVDDANEPLQGSFDGIGISFNILRDTLMVLQTIPGGPSEKVGLAAGDRIIYVDNEMIAGKGITNQGVFDRLRGERGSIVKLKIQRGTESELIEFVIVRDKIPIYSLDASYMLDNKTGYIKLNRFSATTTEEFETALKRMKSESKMENLILDLRGNGGGFLKSAYEIADHFLDFGKMIVYTEGLRSPKKDYTSFSGGMFENGKLVVLIDGGSASASEIVSGAVQDWDRGVIIGRRSFGKGLVQQPYYLTDGSMVRLTTAHYYTPSGRCIQRPYDDGVDEYQKDLIQRSVSGELFSKDSIKVDESLSYNTLINKRVVYAGGGIVPDIFMPLDTSSYYKYYNQLLRKSIINQFVLNYVDKNRKELTAKYPDFKTFSKNYEVSDSFLESLWEEGVKQGIEKDQGSISFLKDHAKNHLKAIVARDLWNSSEFYEVINSRDNEILKALSVINNSKEYDSILKGK
ncbi:MAG: S41 family peptidase [Prolixibacteraceae bacterium]|nr:S41 family peptidase [Prolixibacteraceae bacterium]